jgi:hypothetical protein
MPKILNFRIQNRVAKIIRVDDQPTTLWKVRRDAAEVECRVRLMPYGIDVDIIRGGAVVLTRTFETDTEALEWAGNKRAAREAEGWTLVPQDQNGTGRIS